MPREVAAGHPTYKYRLRPGARCELEAGHDGAHRNGVLLWNDPPVIVVVDQKRPQRARKRSTDT